MTDVAAKPTMLNISSSHTMLNISSSQSITFCGSQIFEIPRFSSTKIRGVGDYMPSDAFLVGEHSWKLHVYPTGVYREDSGDGDDIHIALNIALVTRCKEDLRAWFEYAILDQNGNTFHKVDTTYTIRPDMSGPHTDRRTINPWTQPRFYKRTDLETSQYIKDDRLIIKCTVRYVATSVPRVIDTDLLEDYKELLESGRGSDVSFNVEGEIFHAHKIILSLWSPVFKTQFFGPLAEENTGHIKIENMQARVFKALLYYIYCRFLPVDSFDRVDIVMTPDLLVAADRYGIQSLRSICESILCKNVGNDIDALGRTLALAKKHGCLQLKSRCLEVISYGGEIFEAFKQTDGFKKLKEDDPAIMDELLKVVARGPYDDYMPLCKGKRLKLTK